MQDAEFSALFRGHPVPPALAELLKFQTDVDTQYVRGLWLSDTQTYGLTCGWSDDPAFLERLVAFAVASASGSFYALWDPRDGSAPDEWPVIAFGDEGGEWVVAQSCRELLRLAALNVEPMVMHGGVMFFVDDEDEDEDEGPDADGYVEGDVAYRQWLKNTLGLTPAEDPAAVVAAAQQRWQTAFDEWKQPFLP